MSDRSDLGWIIALNSPALPDDVADAILAAGWVPGELLAAEQARNATLADTIARARTLHTPHFEIDGVQHDHVVTVGDDDLPPDHVCRVGGWDTCIPAYEEHYVLACGECRQMTEDAEPGAPLWPCPTAQALDGPGEEDG